MFTEEPHSAESLCIHLVHQRFGIFRQTCRKNAQFVVFRHFLEEVIDARPLLDEDITDCALDVHRDNEVWVFDLIKLTMHKSLIQIQHQRLHMLASFRRWPQHAS